MAERWTQVSDAGRAKVLKVLERALQRFRRDGDSEGVEAVEAAKERLPKKQSDVERTYGGVSDLRKRLAAPATQAEAIADMAAAVRRRAGIDGAWNEPKIRVGKRTFYRLLEDYPKAREAVDAVLRELVAPVP